MTSASWLLASGSVIGNHLWQSTLVAATAALLMLALRNNRAQVRYWLWLAASLKFLLPFALLVAAGSHVGWQSSASTLPPDMPLIVEVVSQPFAGSPVLTGAAAQATSPSSVVAALPFVALVIWACGCATLLLTWCARWRRVAAIVRGASPVSVGREVDSLRRLEAIAGITRPIALVSTDACIEPGIFGIARPVLLWPRTMVDHLDDAQVDAILCHEVAHVRRRDNLAAAAHMLVEAIFWFHPLVWWLGARLVAEREHACDEDVIRSGSDRAVYATSILQTCRRCVESPLACVAGVTGASLTRRIQHIMSSRSSTPLGALKATALATVAAAVIVVPLASGMSAASRLPASVQLPDVPPPAVDVASIRPNKSGDPRSRIQIQAGGRLVATNATLRNLLRNAYELQDFQIVGGPAWMDANHYDIETRADQPNPTRDQFRLMTQQLMADRFALKAHFETRELPIYALVAARDGKRGPQLRESAIDCDAMMRGGVTPPAPPAPNTRPACGTRMAFGTLNGGSITMAQLAAGLAIWIDRLVVDRTGLTGIFDVDLRWLPDAPPAQFAGVAQLMQTSNAGDVSIFTAVQEQLGLKLESTRGPVSVLVIDHAEQPAEN